MRMECSLICGDHTRRTNELSATTSLYSSDNGELESYSSATACTIIVPSVVYFLAVSTGAHPAGKTHASNNDERRTTHWLIFRRFTTRHVTDKGIPIGTNWHQLAPIGTIDC